MWKRALGSLQWRRRGHGDENAMVVDSRPALESFWGMDPKEEQRKQVVERRMFGAERRERDEEARQLWSRCTSMDWKRWVLDSKEMDLSEWNDADHVWVSEDFWQLPLVHDLLVLLREHEDMQDVQAYARDANASPQDTSREEGYTRFIECLVGDYLVWRCAHMGFPALLKELHESKQSLARDVILRDVWRVRPRVHALMVAWNALRELNEAIDNVWRLPRARAVAEEHGIMRRTVLNFHWHEGFSVEEETTAVEDFHMLSFADWLNDADA